VANPPIPPGSVIGDPVAVVGVPNSHLIVTDIEIANAARDAGFRDDQPPADTGVPRHSELVWAVAIALSESSGDRTAVGRPADGSYVIGLWQIKQNSLDKRLFDPGLNAERAFALYSSRGRKFDGTWSVFPSPASGNGARAEVAVRATHRDRPGFTRLEGLGTLGDVLEQAGLALRFLTSGQTWIRLGEALGGAILIGLALYMLWKTSLRGGR
jgi:Lysozyme like domain